MPQKVLDHVFNDAKERIPSERLVLLVMANSADDYGFTDISIKSLAEQVSLTPRQVMRIIAQLAQHGDIHVNQDHQYNRYVVLTGMSDDEAYAALTQSELHYTHSEAVHVLHNLQRQVPKSQVERLALRDSKIAYATRILNETTNTGHADSARQDMSPDTNLQGNFDVVSSDTATGHPRHLQDVATTPLPSQDATTTMSPATATGHPCHMTADVTDGNDWYRDVLGVTSDVTDTPEDGRECHSTDPEVTLESRPSGDLNIDLDPNYSVKNNNNNTNNKVQGILQYLMSLYGQEIAPVTPMVVEELAALAAIEPNQERWAQVFRDSVGIQPSRWKWIKRVIINPTPVAPPVYSRRRQSRQQPVVDPNAF